MNDCFGESLNLPELLLNLFLVATSDGYGLSYYSKRSISTLIGVSEQEYEETKDRLVSRNLIAVSGWLFQVLSHPAKPVSLSENSKRDVGQRLKTIGERTGSCLTGGPYSRSIGLKTAYYPNGRSPYTLRSAEKAFQNT